jgi:hypothetical protein
VYHVIQTHCKIAETPYPKGKMGQQNRKQSFDKETAVSLLVQGGEVRTEKDLLLYFKRNW